MGRRLARFLYAIILILVACQSQGISTVQPTATPIPPVPVSPQAPEGIFWIDPSQDLGQISKFVLGTNYGPWAGLSPSNLDPAKNSGITFLRWPGGSWGDQNNVQPYQIDSYIYQTRLMGAEPSITVRLLGGTPDQAAQLVRYVNLDRGYGVKYWSIGNEPDLYVIQDNSWTPEFYAKRWREFATAMKSVDPTIRLYGPEISAFLGDPDHLDPRELLYVKAVRLDFTKRDYLTEFLKMNVDLVDIVAVHHYPFPKKQNESVPDWTQLNENVPEWDRIIPNLRRIVGETTGRDKPVGITEFNSTASNALGSETSPDSFYNAIWLADVLGRLIRTQPELIAYWLLKNSTAGHGLMDSYNLRPTYYVYQIYKQFGNHLLVANSPEEEVSLFAARRDDGTLTAIFVNRSAQEVSKSFRIEVDDDLKLTEIYSFDAEHNAEKISPPAFQNGDEIRLPAYSVTLFILK